MRVSKQELKNYVVNSIAHNEFNPNELLRLINLLPDQPQLNENQQIVLDYIKYSFLGYEVTRSIFYPIHSLLEDPWNSKVKDSYWELTLKEEVQVLEVFSQWALEQESGASE